MAIERAIAKLKMKGAFKEGMSFNRFIIQMRAEGLSYARPDMLGDWRSENNLQIKEGTLKYVRKDRIPSSRVIAEVTYKLKKEYMYVMKVKTQLKPGEPITERNVNIQTDKPMTPREMEQETAFLWAEREKYAAEELVSITPFTAMRRVME